MQLLPSEELIEHIQNIVHKDTQLHKTRIDLTVDEIYQVQQPGSLDFGGSEYEPATADILNPHKRNKNDDYGWWELKAGCYKAKFNEDIALDEQILALMNPHTHAREAGIIADTQIIESSGQLTMMFDVPEVGCNIKENARFAAIHLFRT